ncbi:hypothetical protein BJV74DRAFT_849815, partial [Russula compacta]
PPPFSPPTYAIWVNSLWFLSLVISLNAALLATSITQPPRCSPERRARMRAFFADVEGLPALLHLSLFLFFSGLLVFLFNIDYTIFRWVIGCVGVFLTMYGWITLVPIFRHDSPYYAPLSGSVWLLYTGIPCAFFNVLAYLGFSRFCDLRNDYYRRAVGGVEMAAGETAWKQSSVIDLRTLGEDDLLEKFFDAIPGFFNSSLVKGLDRDSAPGLRWPFLLRTLLSSNSIPDSVKIHAADAMDVSFAYSSAPLGVEQVELALPQSIETGHALSHWCTSKDSLAKILMAVSQHDDRWIALAKDQFGLPEDALQDNIAHGDNSVLLSILIHLTRQFIHSCYYFDSWAWNFDIQRTVPGLQHEFCALWNEIVLDARNQGPDCGPIYLLLEICHAYIALHQGTDAAPTAFSASTDPHAFPLDPIMRRPSSHRSDSTPDYPHPFQGETQPVPAASPVHATAEEIIIATSPTDLAITWSDSTSPHAQSFPSASPTTEPVHMRILPKATSLPDPPVLTPDLNLPIQIAVSCQPPQSMLSATDSVEPDNPTTDVHSTTTREASHAASASSPTFPHPDPILAIVTPAPGERQKQDTCTATRSTTAHIEDISSMASPISQHIPSCGATLPLQEDHEATVLRFLDSDSPSSPIVIPASGSDVIPIEHPSSVESAPIRSAPESLPSSPLTTHSHVPSVSDAHVTTTIGAPSANVDLSASTPMVALPHLSQSVPRVPDIVINALPSEDVQHGQN